MSKETHKWMTYYDRQEMMDHKQQEVLDRRMGVVRDNREVVRGLLRVDELLEVHAKLIVL